MPSPMIEHMLVCAGRWKGGDLVDYCLSCKRLRTAGKDEFYSPPSDEVDGRCLQFLSGKIMNQTALNSEPARMNT